MIWNAKTKWPSPKAGDYKYVLVFAWLPTRVGDQIVWLESYQEVYKYVFRKRVFTAGSGYNVKGFSFPCNGWDFQYSRLLDGRWPTRKMNPPSEPDKKHSVPLP